MPSLPDLNIVRRTLETYAIAAIGGAILQSTGFPAGVVAGSVLAVALTAIAGRPLIVPIPVRDFMLVMIGIVLGSAVTPATLKGISAYPVTIAILVVAMTCTIIATATYLRKVHRWDALSALCGASPGAFSQSAAIAAELGADLRGVSIVQTVRLVVLTVLLPAILALLGLVAPGPGRLTSQPVVATVKDAVLLFTVPIFTALLLRWIRFPAGLVFGSMLGAGALCGSGVVQGGPPTWFAFIAVMAVGAMAGSNFAGLNSRLALRFFGAAIGSVVVSSATCAVFVVVATYFTDAPASELVLSYTPGAQDAMMVLALALGLDPVFVGAHHVARFLHVSLLMPYLIRRVAGRAR